MQIDHCLILAAGFGTRMGVIGQKLPKVLWPVFEKTLLELQVGYARSLGISNIYVNLHHMGDEIETRCQSMSVFEGVKFLWERPEILDIGGAIHNLASRSEIKYKGKLLVLNADQFFYVRKEELDRFLAPHTHSSSVLFTYIVDSSRGYNALVLDKNKTVKGIVNNKELPQATPIQTYTGISLVDLGQLDKVTGKSSFFDSVAAFSKKEVRTIQLESVDYWDFGTVKRYWESIMRILSTYKENSNHPFLRFLVSERSLKTWKIDLQRLSYHACGPCVVNFDHELVAQDLPPTIILKGIDVVRKDGPTIWWNGIYEDVR